MGLWQAMFGVFGAAALLPGVAIGKMLALILSGMFAAASGACGNCAKGWTGLRGDPIRPASRDVTALISRWFFLRPFAPGAGIWIGQMLNSLTSPFMIFSGKECTLVTRIRPIPAVENKRNCVN